MKQPKKFTRDQKVTMTKKHIDPTKYVLVQFDTKQFVIQHKESKEIKTITY